MDHRGEPLLLMTPGPTRVPDRVLRAGARPMLHHRSPEFSSELGAMLEMLRPVFGTANPVLPVHATGRGSMEAAVCNLFSPGDEIAVCCNGRFGEMWAGFAASYGLVVHRIVADWTRNVDADEVDAFLARPSGGACGRGRVLRHVDRRAKRRRERVPRGARAERARARRRRVRAGRNAVRVRRMGRGRCHHVVAEVPHVESGHVVRRAQRRARGPRTPAPACRATTGISWRSATR